jgi:hypothetical protein
MNGYVCILQYANVDNLYLSQTEIAWEAENDRGDQSTPRLIEVSTAASDPEGDVLTYNYEVSAGKIVGQGKKVVWDLTGVRPGTYLITAGVNDGCGICGMTKTRRVEIYLPGTQPLRETD